MLYLAHTLVPTCSSRAILPWIRGTESVAFDQRCIVALPRYSILSIAAIVWGSLIEVEDVVHSDDALHFTGLQAEHLGVFKATRVADDV